SDPARFFLHTSPEFAMKRLLAAGSGDIYQICHVVRGLERGRQHNAEFTLIEWYRLGFTLEQLMDEVEALVREVLSEPGRLLGSQRVTYREAFVDAVGIDPLTCTHEQLVNATRNLGYEPAPVPSPSAAAPASAAASPAASPPAKSSTARTASREV